MMDKNAFRKYCLARRRAIPASAYPLAAARAAQALEQSALFKKSESISAYFPFGGEFDCIPIIELIWRAGKQCYLPVLAADGSKRLDFLEYHQGVTLKSNRYGILEPEDGTRITADQLDLVLLPLLAFDRSGHRLGWGGGYYDRTFAFCQNTVDSSVGPKRQCHLIGVGFSAQIVDTLPADPWDVRLEGALTEEGLMFFKRRDI